MMSNTINWQQGYSSYPAQMAVNGEIQNLTFNWLIDVTHFAWAPTLLLRGMRNEQRQTVTPTLSIQQLSHGKFHRVAKAMKFLEALLASEFRLERQRSAMLSDLNLRIHISACGSATLYSGSTKLRLPIDVRVGAHSAPRTPDGKGERGHKTQSKRAQASPAEKSQVWAVVLARTWGATAKTADASGLEERLSPVLTWQCMCYGWSVYLVCKGKREKPNKLAVTICLQCQRLSN